MPFEFVHYIDDFIKLKGNSRIISPLDYNRFFGKNLSKQFLSKLQEQPELADSQVFSPKTWSMALITEFDEQNNYFFTDLLNKTDRIVCMNSCYKLSKKKNAHISWNFFGECTEKVLTDISYSMKNFLKAPDTEFEKLLQHQFNFNKLDYILSGGTQNAGSYIMILSPSPDDIFLINKIEKKISSAFNYTRTTEFIPHLTIARIKNMEKYISELKDPVENIWKNAALTLNIGHFILVRSLDHLSDQKIFGILKK